MKRLLNRIKTTRRLSSAPMLLLAVALVLPVLILGMFGLIAVIDYGYILHFVVLLAFCALLITALNWILRRPSPGTVHLPEEGLREP